jgi:hydroxymethylpyrimidine pyrophosphatase-like HAD family hydrolase
MPTIRLHQPDINGTHASVGEPLSAEAVEIIQEWTSHGHLFAPNTSFVFKKIERNINMLANAPYICELGVAVYEPDGAKLLIYHALDADERETIASVFERDGSSIATGAFCPRSEGADHHGMYVFVHPETSAPGQEKLLRRHFAIEARTSDHQEFAGWVRDTEFGLLEWKPRQNCMVEGFGELHQSNNSSGMSFITPHGMDKATTFLEFIELRFKQIPMELISVAGDSKSTDGPLFGIPDITHVAVGDATLLQGVTGKNVFCDTPDEANRYLRTLLRRPSVAKARRTPAGL